MTPSRGRAVLAARPLSLAALAVASVFATSSAAQTALDARAVVGSRSSDATPGGGPDLSGGASVEHLFASEHGTLRFAVRADRFPGEAVWSSRLHALSASWRADLRSDVALYVRGNGTLRSNDGEWSDSGFRAVSGGATLEWRRGSWLNLRLGADATGRDFPQLEELGQQEADGFLAMRLNGSTRTTLIAEIRRGTKRYAATRSAVLALPHDQSSRGRGAGRGAVAYLVETSATRRASAGSFLVRAAQGLNDALGVWAQADRRWVGGDVPPLLLAAPPVLLDDGVYDDPYATGRTSWSAGATWRAESGRELSLSGAWDRRKPRDAATGTEERIRRLSAELEWPLAETASGLTLAVLARYEHLRRTGTFAPPYRSGVVAAGLLIAF